MFSLEACDTVGSRHGHMQLVASKHAFRSTDVSRRRTRDDYACSANCYTFPRPGCESRHLHQRKTPYDVRCFSLTTRSSPARRRRLRRLELVAPRQTTTVGPLCENWPRRPAAAHTLTLHADCPPIIVNRPSPCRFFLFR